MKRPDPNRTEPIGEFYGARESHGKMRFYQDETERVKAKALELDAESDYYEAEFERRQREIDTSPLPGVFFADRGEIFQRYLAYLECENWPINVQTESNATLKGLARVARRLRAKVETQRHYMIANADVFGHEKG